MHEHRANLLQPMKLTPAQRETLEILGEATEPVPGWKHSNERGNAKTKRRSRLNYIAAGKLCGLGLARMIASPYYDGFSHRDKYKITDLGRAELAHLQALEAAVEGAN